MCLPGRGSESSYLTKQCYSRIQSRVAFTKHRVSAGFGKLEKRVRTTGGGASGSVRNLRIREDTAKYLHNLDPISAHYDPKSRSMRADPQPHKPANEKAFMGDNWTRQSGDFHGLQALTVHSVNAQNAGSEIHPQAAPSQVRSSSVCLDGCSAAATFHDSDRNQ